MDLSFVNCHQLTRLFGNLGLNCTFHFSTQPAPVLSAKVLSVGLPRREASSIVSEHDYCMSEATAYSPQDDDMTRQESGQQLTLTDDGGNWESA